MLIVVAIIAILVAVSIPLVSNSLEKTRRATDAANERAAKAEAVIMYLNDDIDFSASDEATLYYDAEDGSLHQDNNPAGHSGYGKCSRHPGAGIHVTVSKDDGTVEVKWHTNTGVDSGIAHNGDVDTP